MTMKYIRTKDGHIAKVVKYYEEDGIYNIEIDGKPYFSVFEDNVCGVADTIEALCDEFIVVSDNCERPIISALPFNELQLYAKGRTKYAICYGAIWTDKGLIYVAKMNDRGELELL